MARYSWIPKNFQALVKFFINFLYFLRKTYKKLLGKSKAARCMSPGISKFSQVIFANVVLRISANWASVNLTSGF